MRDRNILLSTIFGIIALIFVTILTTYAFFTVSSTNDYTSSNMDVRTGSIGSIAFVSGDNLSLSLTAPQMMRHSTNINYYASKDGTTTEEVSPIIATANVTGEGKFNCHYKIRVAATGTRNMYEAFQGMGANKSEDQIVLKIGNQVLDFNTANLFPKEVEGDLNGITKDSPLTSRQVTSQLKFVNRSDKVQDALAGTDITLTFTSPEFTCTIAVE